MGNRIPFFYMRFLPLALILVSLTALAQKEVRTYYDPMHMQVDEDYFVREDDNQMEGKFRKYFPNGRLAIEGTFVNGLRSGTFYEYHINGTLIRKINYENGMRHGAVEVFNEKGKPIQTAYYKNNLLIDSVRTYFPTGVLKMESKFAEGKPDGYIKEYYPKGSIRKEIEYKNQKPNGITKTYYESGVLETEANYKDGFIVGYYKSYFPNAQLELVYTIKEGDKVGDFMSYDPQGHLLLVGHFMNGKLHGKNIGYYTDKVVRHEYTFDQGSKVGTNTDYFHNAKTKTKEQFSLNGIDSELTEYDTLGNKVFVKNFRRNKPHGTWYFYAKDGKTPLLKETYEESQLNGLRTTYHPNGQKKVEETCKFDLITGPVKNFYETGKLLSECEYRASRMHGIYKKYWPDGKTVQEEGEYVANKKHKEWKEYDQQGKLLTTTNFRAGILIEPKVEEKK